MQTDRPTLSTIYTYLCLKINACSKPYLDQYACILMIQHTTNWDRARSIKCWSMLKRWLLNGYVPAIIAMDWSL